MAMTVAVAAFATAGCGGGGAPSGSGGGATSSTAGKAEYGTVVYGSLPRAGTPKSGGTVSFAQLTGQTPVEIFPMTDSANTTAADFELNGAMYLPLYNGPSGAVPKIDYALSVGEPPSFSDGDRTVTIPLRSGLKWSNGAPVDADDVLFYIALLKAAIKKSAANWAQYDAGEFPVNVTSMSARNRHTVVLHLNRPYNPGYFLNNQLQDTDGGVYPMPSTAWNIASAHGPHLTDWRNPAVAARIYAYLSKAGTSVATFASDPLWKDVDGPFALKDFNVTNGSYDLVPNPSYGLRPKPMISDLSVQTYTSQTAALNALKSGSVDIAPLDASQLGQVTTLRSQGVSVFGAPNFGWNAGILNFEDKADDFDRVIAQPYVRRALQHLVDQPALTTGVYKSAAAAAYGPVPSAPTSPYAPPSATKPLYPYDPAVAVSLLKSHGWKVAPNGQTTCAKPGTGSGQCGAGIPAGTPIKFTWATLPESESTTGQLTAEAVASVAKEKAGIDIQVVTKSANLLSTDYDDSDPSASQYTNDWGVLGIGALLNNYYPTQNGYDSPGSLDIGGYNDPMANRLIHASVYGGNPRAVETEATYITTHPPALFLPNPDQLWGVSKDVGGTAVSWTVLTEGSAFFPQYWYRTG